MTKKAEALEPIEIDEQTWLYVDNIGLRVVRQAKVSGSTEQFHIPWHVIDLARPRPRKTQITDVREKHLLNVKCGSRKK